MYHKHTQDECEKILSDSGFIRYYAIMAEKLNLRPIENAIFSVIYSYISQGQECYASLNQFAEWTATSKPTTIKAIKHLAQIQLIQVSNSIEYCGRPKNYYYINFDILGQYLTGETTPTDSKETLQTGITNEPTPPQNSYEVSKISLPSPSRNFTEDSKETLQRDSKETLPYNNSKIKKEDNKINNNSDNNVQSHSDWTSPPKKNFSSSDEEKEYPQELQYLFSDEIEKIKELYPRHTQGDNDDILLINHAIKKAIDLYGYSALEQAIKQYTADTATEPYTRMLMANAFQNQCKRLQQYLIPF